MANGNGSLEMPRTETPGSVFVVLVLLATLGAVLFSLLFGLWLEWGWFWGVILTLAIFGSTTSVYTTTVPGFYARIVINHLTGKQRTIFQGLHPKLPWETITQDVDLRTDLKDVCKETYVASDALMETKYVYTMRPRFNGEAVVLYASYESEALKQSIRALLSMLLSDYYGRNKGADLLNKLKINQEVFGSDPGRSLVEEFERTHGTEVTARLEDSDFDAETQKARDTVSKAGSIAEAIAKLTEGGKMSQAQAEKTVRMLNIPGITEYIVDVSGIPNVRDINVLGGLGGKK